MSAERLRFQAAMEEAIGSVVREAPRVDGLFVVEGFAERAASMALRLMEAESAAVKWEKRQRLIGEHIA